MYQELLESSEFYHKRYHNFASKIIVPTFSLFLFLVCFLCFMKKEITVKTTATLEPVRVLGHIQSTSSHQIKTNHLKEGLLVKKGDLLVAYESDAELMQEATGKEELERLNKQKQELDLLKASYEQGSSQFPSQDAYGYSQRFEDYLNQRETLARSIDQQNSTISSQNIHSASSQAAIGQASQTVSEKISDYQTVRVAVENGSGLEGHQVYQAYAQQLSTLSTKEDKERLKVQTLGQLDVQIQQWQTELAAYEIQYMGAGAQQAYNTSLDTQLSSLRAQKLAETAQELSVIDSKIAELEGNLNLQQDVLEKLRITASETGILHLNQEVADASLVSPGTLLATLYPLLEEEKEVYIEAYIPSRLISSLAVGDALRFQTQDVSNKEVVLETRIQTIDMKATKTKAGNFFKITAKVNLSDKQVSLVRYGMEGKLIVITGKKTYLDYYMDFLLN